MIGGACDRPLEELGAFQETKQIESTRLYTKFAARPPTLERIPSYVEKAIKLTTYGRPGIYFPHSDWFSFVVNFKKKLLHSRCCLP